MRALHDYPRPLAMAITLILGWQTEFLAFTSDAPVDKPCLQPASLASHTGVPARTDVLVPVWSTQGERTSAPTDSLGLRSHSGDPGLVRHAALEMVGVFLALNGVVILDPTFGNWCEAIP